MTFTLTIRCDNEPFDGDPGVELGAILKQLAVELAVGPRVNAGSDGTLYDVNGNTVGTWQLKGRKRA